MRFVRPVLTSGLNRLIHSSHRGLGTLVAGLALVIGTACTDRRVPIQEEATIAPEELEADWELALGNVAPISSTVLEDSVAVGFRQLPGFYAAPFSLEFEVAGNDADVLYTLDGSIPNAKLVEDHGAPVASSSLRGRTFRYSGPIDLNPWFDRPNQLSLIDTGTLEDEWGWREWFPPTKPVEKAVVVRAQAIRGTEVSPVVSGTFFLDRPATQRPLLPVVSLSTDPAYLFDENIGIYVLGPDVTAPNFAQHGDDWERPAFVEYFDHGDRPIAQWIGTRIHGNFSRGFPQKSLRLYARNEYGSNSLDYSFFGSSRTNKFKRLILRNGGNDWGGTLFRDAAIQSLVAHLPIETQDTQPAIVFINGEYWGIHTIRDRLDEFHLELKYHVPREHIAILQNEGILSEGTDADVLQYKTFLDQLSSGAFSTAAEVDSYFALWELLDYTILQVYAGNTDWPHNNFAYWHYTETPREENGPRDGRWRPMVFDVDRTFGRFGSAEADNIARLLGDIVETTTETGTETRPKTPGELETTRLFRGLLEIEPIRHEFIQRLAIHLSTTFNAKRVSAVVDHFTQTVEKEMPTHIARWGHPATMEDFYEHVEICHTFAQERPDKVIEQVSSFFDEVDGVAKLRIENIDPAYPPSLHGVRLSSDTPGVTLKDGVWEGRVFTGVPLVITPGGVDLTTATVSGAVTRLSNGGLELSIDPKTVVTVRLP